MIIRNGESQRLSVNGGVYGGLLLSAFATGAAVDVTLASTDLNRNNVNIEVYLHRAGRTYTIFNNNWNLLGTYKTRKRNFDAFLNGIVYQYDTVALANIRAYASFLEFESPVHVRNGDVLNVIITSNLGLYGAAVSSALSFLDCILSPSNSIEYGIPQTKFEVVQTNANSGEFVNSSGVARVDFLQFDQATLATIVLNQLNLQSDQLRYQATQLELLTSEQMKYPDNIPYRFTTDNTVAPNNSVIRSQNFQPQSYSVFRAGHGETLNNCVVAATFNSANVNSSQNWFAYDMLEIDARNRAAALNRITSRARHEVNMIAQGSM